MYLSASLCDVKHERPLEAVYETLLEATPPEEQRKLLTHAEREGDATYFASNKKRLREDEDDTAWLSGSEEIDWDALLDGAELEELEHEVDHNLALNLTLVPAPAVTQSRTRSMLSSI